MANNNPAKLLVLDGIAGVPLGREVCYTLGTLGIEAMHFDCLQQRRRPFYALRSAYAKAVNRHGSGEKFRVTSKLVERDFENLMIKEKPSHILVVGFAYKFFSPKFFRRIANLFGTRLFLYDTDSANLFSKNREFVFFVEEELPIYERIFSFSEVTTRFFRETHGLKAVHLPYGALPIQLPSERPKNDVLFVGSGDLRRIFLLESVRKHLAVRGNRWNRYLPLVSPELRSRVVDTPVWGDALYSLLGGAKIVLNITRASCFGIETGLNLRIFEALAAGSFLLTDHCDEIARMFRIGEEIETFRSAGELTDKVEYYLQNEPARHAIASAGHEAFLRNHTWQARIDREMRPMLFA